MINIKELAGKEFATLKEARAKLLECGVEIPHLKIEDPGRIEAVNTCTGQCSYNGVKLFCDVRELCGHEASRRDFTSLDDLASKLSWVKLPSATRQMDRFAYSLWFHGEEVHLMLGNQAIADLNCPAA